MTKDSFESLRHLKELRGSSGLKNRLVSLEQSLPPMVSKSAYVLSVFRFALAGIAVLILLGLGSGVVLAAKGSNPGSILYPLKKVIVQTQINLTTNPSEKEILKREIEESTPLATPVASPTAKPVIKVKEHEDERETEKEVEGVSVSASPLPHISIQPREREDDVRTSAPRIIPRHGDDDSSDN